MFVRVAKRRGANFRGKSKSGPRTFFPNGLMHHLHRLKADLLPCLFPENYRAAQHFVVELQRNNSYGIGYIIGDVGDGVRAVKHVAIFRPPTFELLSRSAAPLDGQPRRRGARSSPVPLLRHTKPVSIRI